MLDLHLELASLYYPDAWGAQAQRAADALEWAKEEDREYQRFYMRGYNKRPHRKAKRKAYLKTPAAMEKARLRCRAYRQSDTYKKRMAKNAWQQRYAGALI